MTERPRESGPLQDWDLVSGCSLLRGFLSRWLRRPRGVLRARSAGDLFSFPFTPPCAERSPSARQTAQEREGEVGAQGVGCSPDGGWGGGRLPCGAGPGIKRGLPAENPRTSFLPPGTVLGDRQVRGRESVYVTSPGTMSSLDAQGGQRCGRRVLQRHPDLNPCLWVCGRQALFSCPPTPQLPTWGLFIGSGPQGQQGLGLAGEEAVNNELWSLTPLACAQAFRFMCRPFGARTKYGS